MGKEQHIPELHSIAHDAATWLGFRYDETAPDWMHPTLHLILVIAPALLAISALTMITRALLFQFRPAVVDTAPRQQTLVTGLHYNLIRHIVQTTRVQQLYLLVLSLSLMPVLYLSLELPKQIVNNVLDSSHSRLTLLGYDLTATQHLAVLSGVFFLTIALNGVGKYHLNVVKGRVAERCLRRLRFLIYRNWRKQTDNLRQSEIPQVLGHEVEPIGGFAADLVSLPITQGGTMITILLFMFVQDPILGAAALTVLPMQLLLLPYLQRIVNRLSRRRIHEMRTLSLSPLDEPTRPYAGPYQSCTEDRRVASETGGNPPTNSPREVLYQSSKQFPDISDPVPVLFARRIFRHTGADHLRGLDSSLVRTQGVFGPAQGVVQVLSAA